ncbi:tripartite tricarboxylate transporter TctB family protein [Enterovirga sp.]|uniref:tripartite tricarboxylate transporter TctB family protein n=1 Tax=Enterovirga sp. TaxID=2026350 RepID=UPI00260B359B|nr:tripartite tricarboxylate transporter TctB family protein [Enterovirga sp.]MDB5591426.1 tripartite tricarboxylate transporter TctB [Enterovirga sp.]
MLVSDRVSGLALSALGAAAAYSGSQLPPVPGQQVGPSAFPTIIGIGLVLCGIMIAAGIGRSFEDEAEADLGSIEGSREALAAAPPPGLLRGLVALLPPALLVFYVLAVEQLGFVPTAAAMLVAIVLAFGGSVRLAIGLAAIAPILVHAVFYKLLRVPLPAGLLPMPW